MRGVSVAVLGAGKMGSAIGKALLECGARVLATRARRELLGELARLGFEPIESNRVAAERADLVIIAVKPWHVESVAREVRDVVVGKPVVSIAAGVRLEKLRSLMPGAIVYRAMPNMGVLVGLSATALAGDRNTDAARMVEDAFRCMGEVFWIDEKLFPAWTGLAGSGPGILASIADALALAGVAAGISRRDAERIVSLLFRAVGELLLTKGFQGLRDEVATPGGTTIEGLRVLEQGARGAIIDSILAAVEKARRLEES
ncbi:pyrroline-5-carboxylate reductase [Pyrolobus fumarii 1A]|uniref:Pyrroline-5-carboxylate reductase n=1 Tax=Pyrolobus fumarii (strain DSM 11204 / 1A) TaxID=694429 RepID=G0EEQ0_PYRF1|nr:pyrroline-5-carboxylate reductase [Pyrolobus fumarii]AEM38872.1 pyrroline-5-carboxylate reductase [Pyrolobus fumarii 1A]